MNDNTYCDPNSSYYDVQYCTDNPWGTFVLFGLGILAGVLLLVTIAKSMRIVQQYQRGVVYRLGRVSEVVRGSGLHFIIPFIERMEKVLVAIEALSLKPQQVITNDDVSLSVQAVVYFRVVKPITAEVEVDDYEGAVKQRAQSVLRQVIGGSDLKDVLSQSEEVTTKIKAQLEEAAAAWGLDIQSVELKDIKLPEEMQRAMAARAEAQRYADAKVIAADGELRSAEKLQEAAARLTDPVALRLRELQTLYDIGTEKNTVVVMDSHAGTAAAQAAAGQIAGQRND